MELVNTEKTDFKVDAVLLWVDGNDISYKTKIASFLDIKNTEKSFKTRYKQINEIEYSIKSILKFAPYIENIFIITDNQIPSFLKEKKDGFSKVSIVDHSIIFKGLETYLPTFNSRTIESCIHRIPQLSEHFIYLNDDFFIINPTSKNDFFTKEGYPILRGNWQKFTTPVFFKKEEKASHKKAQEKAAKILGFNKYFRFKHTPHPIRKSTLVSFFNENPEVLIENIQYKFRNKNQLLPIALAYHLELKKKTCKTQSDLQLMYFRSYKKPFIWYKIKFNYFGKSKIFLGLQNLNKCSAKTLKFILNWLDKTTN